MISRWACSAPEFNRNGPLRGAVSALPVKCAECTLADRALRAGTVHHVSDSPTLAPHACWKRVAVTALIVAFLAVQIAAPIRGLAERGGSLLTGGDLTHHDGRQIYFGWQMFSTTPRTSTYTVTHVDGTIETVDARQILGPIAGRRDYTGNIPTQLCEALAPDARQIAGRQRETTC